MSTKTLLRYKIRIERKRATNQSILLKNWRVFEGNGSLVSLNSLGKSFKFWEWFKNLSHSSNNHIFHIEYHNLIDNFETYFLSYFPMKLSDARHLKDTSAQSFHLFYDVKIGLQLNARLIQCSYNLDLHSISLKLEFISRENNNSLNSSLIYLTYLWISFSL